MIKNILLILIFTIFIVLSADLSPHQQNNLTLNHTGSTEKINPHNLYIQKYFKKVVDVPYKANYTSTVPKTPSQFWKDNYGDCDDKSVAFADYLHKIGVKNVKLVTVVHSSGKYAHCAVMWNNHIFDATAEPPIYNMNQTKYYNLVRKKGFSSWIEYLYVP